MLTAEEFEDYIRIEKEKGAKDTDALYALAPFEPPQAAKDGASIPQTAFHLGSVGDMPLKLYVEWMQKSRGFRKR